MSAPHFVVRIRDKRCHHGVNTSMGFGDSYDPLQTVWLSRKWLPQKPIYMPMA
jgi:hypothetical protein